MRVVFLDFDGVLNSEASFRMEIRKKTEKVSDTLSPIACSNLQRVLEQVPDLRIVISSTWRKLHDLEYLKAKLYHYGVDHTRVIDVTPVTFSQHRGREISRWLEDHTEIRTFVIVDDDSSAHIFDEAVERGDCLSIKTDWADGLSYKHACEIIAFLSKRPPGSEDDI